MQLIVLDAGPLGLLTRPAHVVQAAACAAWLRSILSVGWHVAIPAIADYEVRRELVRLQATRALQQLDILYASLDVIPLTQGMLHAAAELWATSRQTGRPTADPHALDGDVILAAQALHYVQPHESLVVATTNPGHFQSFVPIARWEDIRP